MRLVDLDKTPQLLGRGFPLELLRTEAIEKDSGR
jgi:hypothetical protein